MDKRKLLLASAAGVISVAAMGVVLGVNGLDDTPIAASPSTYSINLDSSKRLTDSVTETTSTILTAKGVAIGVTYANLSAPESGWEILAEGGYFYNTAAITGLLSLSISGSDDASSSLTVYWGVAQEARPIARPTTIPPPSPAVLMPRPPVSLKSKPRERRPFPASACFIVARAKASCNSGVTPRAK